MHKLKGFTLIELMIVVAIIGILAAIVIPAYNCKANGVGKNCKNPNTTQQGQQAQPAQSYEAR